MLLRMMVNCLMFNVSDTTVTYGSNNASSLLAEASCKAGPLPQHKQNNVRLTTTENLMCNCTGAMGGHAHVNK
jgi:hypothetical protein